MLNWLINRVQGLRLQRRAFGTAVLAIDRFWASNAEITRDFSRTFVRDQAVQLYHDAVRVIRSPDPRMANRERLTGLVVEYAQLQVHVLDPAPAPDPTGLRGQPGISGELKPLLFDLWQRDKTLQDFMQRVPTPTKGEDVWNPVLWRYRIVWAWMQVFNGLRFAFEDGDRDSEKDWFWIFRAAMCANQEHGYRRSLLLPPLLARDPIKADMKALTASTFMLQVLQGMPRPDIAWRKTMATIAESSPRF